VESLLQVLNLIDTYIFFIAYTVHNIVLFSSTDWVRNHQHLIFLLNMILIQQQ